MWCGHCLSRLRSSRAACLSQSAADVRSKRGPSTALRAREKRGKQNARNFAQDGGARQRRQSGDWRSQVDARTTPGQARAANSGSPSRLRVNKLPHSTGLRRMVHSELSIFGGYSTAKNQSDLRARRTLHRREIPRLRVPALRAEPKTRDTPLGMTALPVARDGGLQVAKDVCRARYIVPLQS
jgi:hypothetical protein